MRERIDRARTSRGWTLFSVLLTVAALEGLGRLWMLSDVLRPVQAAPRVVRLALYRPPPRVKPPPPPRPHKKPGVKAKKPLPVASVHKKAAKPAKPSVSHHPTRAKAGAGAPAVLAVAPPAAAVSTRHAPSPPRLLTQKVSTLSLPVSLPGSADAPVPSFGGSAGTGGGAGTGSAGSGSGGGAGGEPFGLGSSGGGGGGGPRHVVYVLDISLSMRTRITRARTELLSALDGLGPDESFDIIVFGADTQEFDRALVPATASAKSQAHFFLGTLLLMEGTNLDAALTTALAVPNVNEVFLITDGVPTEGETDWDKLSRRVRGLNTAHAEIDAIGLVGRDPDGVDKSFEGARLLQKLTADSGGHYRQVTLGIDE